MCEFRLCLALKNINIPSPADFMRESFYFLSYQFIKVFMLHIWTEYRQYS